MHTRVDSPDLIVLASRCHTLASKPKAVQAIALRGGRIMTLGSRRSVLPLRGRGTRVVDLGAAVITPGLVDCHTHFFYWALNRALVVDLAPCHTLENVLDRIRAHSRKQTHGAWVLGTGVDHNRWGETFPTAADLDRAVPDRPAMIRARDGHTTWLNTLGMRYAKITARTSDPKGGRYLRDDRGRPTGIVQETAVNLLPNPLRELAADRSGDAYRLIDGALDDAYRIARSMGLVGVHSMDDGPSLFHLQRHHAERRLGLRVVHAVALADLDAACQLGLRSGLGDAWLRIGGVKIFADGALGSQTAYMFEPYPGRGDFCGIPVVAGEELARTVCRAAAAGWAAWIHAIGDRAVHDAVMAISAARRVNTAPLPHRVEHTQCIRPADAGRMARAGIIASVQPCHLPGDVATANRHWPRARRNAYCFRRLLDAGVMLACGSDVPIESLDPRRSLFGAAHRTDEQGAPAGGWFPRERITVEETLRGFTIGAAAASGAATGSGTLTVGAAGDLTVWERDPVRTPSAALREIGVRGCIIDGQLHLNGEGT